jgi:hypothetical protein
MSNFEEYIVSSTIEISSHLFKLNVTPKPGSVEFSPVRSILLVRGATFLTGRTGLEIGYGATVYLEDADFDVAWEHIDASDYVNYFSNHVSGEGTRNKALIHNFNFPEFES